MPRGIKFATDAERLTAKRESQRDYVSRCRARGICPTCGNKHPGDTIQCLRCRKNRSASYYAKKENTCPS